MIDNKVRNIVYIGNFDLDKGNAATERILNNYKLLDKKKYIFNVVGFSNNFVTKRSRGIKYSAVKKPKSFLEILKYFFSMKRFNSVISERKENIIILYNLPSLLSYNIILKYEKKAKIVMDITEIYTDESKNIIYRAFRKADNYFNEFLVKNRIKGAIIISDYLRAHLHLEDFNKYIVIPPLVDEQKIIIDTKEKEGLTRNSLRKTVFTYAGYPGKEKDRLDLILTSFDRIYRKRQDFILNIFGVTFDELKEIYPNISEIITNSINYTNFHGYKDRSVVFSTLSGSDYSIIIRNSSLRNNCGFPTKFSECHSLGIPIIFNDFSDLGKYVRPQDIFISKPTVEHLSEAIINALNKESGAIPSYILSTRNENFKSGLNTFLDNISDKKEEEHEA